MRTDVLLDGICEDFGRRTDVVHGIVRGAVRDLAELSEVFELVVGQVRIEAAEDVERIVIALV